MKFVQPTDTFMTSTSRLMPRSFLPYLIAVALAVLILCIYWQVGSHAFIGLDDEEYVSGNSQVLRGLTLDGVSWAFTTFHAANWHPLTWLSHMLDVELFGPSAGWHLRMNVLYHLLNTELFFFVLWGMTGGLWQSAVVAALFGVHPLHVESVVWVAERKDVLSTLFWILTIAAYLRYVKRPGGGRYFLMAITFAFGLMCKPMLVTLPFTLLLLDYWPLARVAGLSSIPARSGPPQRCPAVPVRRLLLEKVPLFALLSASCVVTYVAQSTGGALIPSDTLLPAVRVTNAVFSYAVYVAKTVWPSRLAVFYPHAGIATPLWITGASIIFLSVVTYLVVRHGHRRPYLPVGWFFFLGTLVPVIGLVQVGAQAMADRYSYVPSVGLFIMVAWGGCDILRRIGVGETWQNIIALGIVVALSAAAWIQVGHWRDDETLFSHAIKVTKDNWLAHNNLGQFLLKRGLIGEASGHFREALRIRPHYPDGHYNLGMALSKQGHFDEAIAQFKEALKDRPEYAEAHNNLGVIMERQGMESEAIFHYRESLNLGPNAESYHNMGRNLLNHGRIEEALLCFREAIGLKPEYAEAHNNMGVALGRQGRVKDAFAHFNEALRLRPDYGGAHLNLGLLLSKQGEADEAIAHFREVLRLMPGNPEAVRQIAILSERK